MSESRRMSGSTVLSEHGSEARATVESPPLAVRAPKYPFLDGLRGLCCLYVVIHHAVQIYFQEPCDPSAKFFRLYPYLILGNYAVAAAITLSGFGLMLSALHNGGKLRGGLAGWFGRRIWRVVP